MAEIDNLIAQWISNNLKYFIIAAVIFWILRRNEKDIKQRWFAWVLHMFTKERDMKIEEVKKDLFASLGSMVSHDPELREKKAIKILEIGVGTGVNFSHYPDGSRLIVVDPNPHFVKYYDANRKKFPNIHSEEIVVTTGENMDIVPDNSVDAVVMTLVLCSVEEIDKIMQQILRVLVPGGKYFFLEHIREFDTVNHSVRQKLQDFLTFSGIWPFLFDGCCLDRDMLASIKAAGFLKVDGERFHAPINGVLFQLIKPHLKGVAEK